MATQDRCCTIVPYFRIHNGKVEEFKTLSAKCVAQTMNEPGCLFYGFSFDGEQAHCREGYKNAEAALAHIENVGPLLTELLKIADVTRFELHGPDQELAKLRGPFADFKPQYFILEHGFRR